ncbi:thioredoxin-dependent thiol peroxidase [Candidatus Saccharibacteria bacterium]|nr:thioredoxin-dependent thiol peroxidase [Candidatus Saccharibacteria bacterium]MDQ5958864.1 thioredoxin-dependent peroxiredoxin [Patescibacteria group bacterium]
MTNTTKAPDFNLPDQDGNMHSLKQYKGKWVILYFYPKDATPGCTKEACSFRDGRDYLQKQGVVVLGVSKDSVESHKKFATKHNLNFTLLSDASADTIKAYGAWGINKFMGKEYEGVKRNTYLIDPSGNIAKTYLKVNPITHVGNITKDLAELKSK